jgi:transcription initiation factor IIE alpha subunit
MDAALILLVLGGIVALAVVGYLWVRSRALEDESFYHFLCPGCRHRLRYQARQVGHRGKCSHCGKLLTFPPTSESID